MRRVSPATLRQPAAVPGIYATGFVTALAPSKITVSIDGATSELDCNEGECFALKWHERKKQAEYMIIAKAWVSYWDFTRKRGKRILRVQAHSIRDGTLGRRWILAEYHNGLIVKGK